MDSLKTLAALTAFAIFVPLAAVYFYRAYHDTRKRVPKILKGLNYLYFSVLINHGVFGAITPSEFAGFMTIGVFLLGVMELSYHIDILLDMGEQLRSTLTKDR